MGKLKYQGGLTKLIASKIATLNRTSFTKILYNDLQLKKIMKLIDKEKQITLQVVSYSSSNDFSEQFISILSFIAQIGNPESWIIYSDGTHTSKQIKILETAFVFLKVVKVNFDSLYFKQNAKNSLLPYQEEFIHFAERVVYGKKLFFYLNFEVNIPTLFIDSDVMFYQKASCLTHLLNENFNGWFLPDADWGTLDNHYMKDHSPQHYQVNSGCFLCNRNLDSVDNGLDYFRSLKTKYEHFTEQNVLHIILKDNGFMPLDPRIFILNSGDQFDFSYLMSSKEMALRHYTGPVRHKMWQRNWKWHLSTS